MAGAVNSFFFQLTLYSDNQKTREYENDFVAILKWIWCCYTDYSFARHL